MNRTRAFSRATFVFLFLPLAMSAQGTLADYQPAAGLRAKYQAAALNIPDMPSWLDGSRFWYRKSVPGGHEFVIVDASTGAKTPAFDHGKLAESLNRAAETKYAALTLPFSAGPFPIFTFVEQGKAV
jgi:hypothetical protein